MDDPVGGSGGGNIDGHADYEGHTALIKQVDAEDVSLANHTVQHDFFINVLDEIGCKGLVGDVSVAYLSNSSQYDKGFGGDVCGFEWKMAWL